ncbi:MAG: YebC/PmpR family DNA-binding transcriptional regulator [Bacteroidales bacterium]|jgi:YebC/PmpR family DNA-binding regulatory protein|nr:YebC/PmpR family DNA-binding transcriptional regulator [Bacteroidales bacterium]MDD2324147.1 YebC/PmpR family DNA-binding transcriptional regulator [Bacteroidales bacterium]MDD3010748.1 YebC/PmpR family DNA-binding transcriptional regulator [Bacteroidales bacterium]MDD3961491.1 YebC/PmpR family DNA-binding transcriptional regulator [Bacteroidales bacterium]MDY0285701.1 YebC/PmpR family DNA-binding transcriptional regulator [Bacteroidales bacterium]
MSGHNKWSTIKRKKGANDAKRSKIFSKIIKDITIAVKEGGADAESNPRLRLAISNAKGASMPKDNILRAINKGKEKDAANFEELTYEGYAPHGIAVVVEALSDNSQRTVANVRAIFNKYNGSLGKNGSLSFLFDRKGIFTLKKGNIDMEELELEIIDAGAEDFELEEDMITITTSMENFGNMMKKLEEMGIETESAELQRIPNNTETLDLESARKVLKMIDAFDEDDDVTNVYHNLEITEELMNEM